MLNKENIRREYIMPELQWTPDGEKVFDKLIQAVPEAMRDAVKPKLIEMLASRAGGKPVDTAAVEAMVREDVPEPQRSALMGALGLSDEQQPPAADDVPAVAFTGKSEIMFETMLGEVPEAMRGVFRGKLLGVISQKAGSGDVVEDHIIAVVNEIVPEPFKSTILKKFKELGDFDPAIIDEIIARHGTSQDCLMFILHDIQNDVGYLPVEALQAVSNKCGIALSTVYSVATFYKAFKLSKPGAHHIKLCCGTACHLKDNAGIAAVVEEAVNRNHDMTMETTLCLGCCDCGPVVEVDGKLYSGEKAQTKIESLR